MLLRSMKWATVLVCLGLSAIVVTAQAAQYNRLIAFGDSYSDDALGFHDDNGFNRYTNGPVWVEYLARDLGMDKLDDRAWGGAMTGQGGASGIGWSDLLWQVKHFKPSRPLDQTLITIWIGYNDVYDGQADIATSIGHVASALDMLADKGMRHVLVLNLPTIAQAPAYNAGNAYADKADAVRRLVQAYNKALHAMLLDGEHSFAARHPNVDVHFFDAHGLFVKMVNGGAFDNVQDPWHGTHQYPKAGQYMWWDNWHPMTAVHRRVAAAIADTF